MRVLIFYQATSRCYQDNFLFAISAFLLWPRTLLLAGVSTVADTAHFLTVPLNILRASGKNDTGGYMTLPAEI